MMRISCPRCGSKNIMNIGEDNYRCMNCGYVGNLSGKEIYKK